MGCTNLSYPVPPPPLSLFLRLTLLSTPALNHHHHHRHSNRLEGTTSLKGKVAYTGGDAWISIGPSAVPDGDMEGAEVVIGLPDAGTVKRAWGEVGLEWVPTDAGVVLVQNGGV